MASKLKVQIGTEVHEHEKSTDGPKIQACLRAMKRPFRSMSEFKEFIGLTTDEAREAFAAQRVVPQ